MTDEHQMNVELQRARMVDLLRNAKFALMIADNAGQMVVSFMNLNPAERRGLIDALQETKPKFFTTGGEHD